MLKYYLSIIPQAFHSKQLYRDVGGNSGAAWPGSGIVYLLILSLIFSIASALNAIVYPQLFKGGYPQQNIETESFVKQIPEMELKQGELTVYAQQPHIIKDDTGRDYIVIDTTGTYDYKTGQYAAFIGKNFYITRGNNKSESGNLPKMDLQITHEKIEKWLSYFNILFWFLPILFIIFVSPFVLVFKLVVIFLYSIPALIIDKIFKTNLSYGTIFNLAAIANTPVFIFDTIVQFLGPIGNITRGIPLSFSIIVTLVYLVIAFKANKETPPAS